MNSYYLKVTCTDGNEVAVSPYVGCDENSVNLLVDNLDNSLFYNFTIKCNNSKASNQLQQLHSVSIYISILNFWIITQVLSYYVIGYETV